jgi:signal transduction histidine kinase/ligand-binding sensor domain-containing protein
MNSVRRFFALAAFIAMTCFGNLHGQPVTDFHARLFPITSNDGLSQGFVPSIIQDHRGFIWFATKDGLNKYDGYVFTIYRHDPEDTNSIAENFILNIFEDSRGYLWITMPDNLQVFDPLTEKFSSVNLTINGKKYSPPNKIQETADGDLLCDGFDGLLRLHCEVRDKDKTFFPEKYRISFQLINYAAGTKLEAHTTRPFLDADNGLWIMKADSVFYTALKPGEPAERSPSVRYSMMEFTHLPGKFLHAYSDTARHLLITILSGGISVYNTQTKTFRNAFPKTLSNIPAWNAINEDESGNVWVATDNGLFIYHPAVNRLERFMPLNIDSTVWSSYSVKSILIDRSGITWMGTNGFGVFKYNPRVSFFNLVSISGISTINGTNDGRITISDHDGLFILDTVACKAGAPFLNDKILVQHRGKEEIHPRDFRQDKQGYYWIDYGSGKLGKYDERTNQVKFYQLNEPGGFAFNSKIWLDEKSEPWISIEKDADISICHFNPATETFDTPVPFPEKRLSGMYSFISFTYADKDGTLWFATIQGVFAYSPKNGSWKTYKNIPGDKTSPGSNIVFAICPDPVQPSEFIWLGTNSAGINRLEKSTGKFLRFTDKDGLPNNVIYALQTDNDSNLWMSTNHGLCRFNVLTHVAKNYFAGDGLQGNEFNRYVVYKSQDGRLFFGGVNGMNFFHPEKLNGDEHPPSVVFTGFRLYNQNVIPGDSGSVIQKPLDFLDEVTLSYDQNVITIEFAAMDFAAPEKNQFKYKLEGFDKDWIFSGTRHEAIYTGLEPGEYRLVVMASNSEGTWSKEPKSIRIIILPPWWETWWARTLFIFAAIGLIVLIILLRTTSLRRSRKILEEKVKERTRELDETIADLRNTQKQLIKNEKLASFGQLTAGIAHEIKNPLNFINNFSLLSNELVEELKLAKTEEEKEELIMSLQNNLEKINFHGNRVDSIIKSMLNHSRTAGARKQPTNINQLCEEFSNLAYHSMRANVQDFSCSLKMELDKTLPQVNAVPQDISRVLLNLLNNAFYAVNEKRKNAPADFKPEVRVSTLHEGDSATIIIRDNGSGIPPEVMEKLFDPFFTTKPAGEGTGLGLSITYDIIHSHGGKISVDSKPGEFTAFTIRIPVNNSNK